MIKIKELDVTSFGVKIAYHRDLLNLSRAELARKSGYSESHIASLENGNSRRLDIKTVLSISQALGVSLDVLLEDSLNIFSKKHDKTEKIMGVIKTYDNRQLELFINLLDDYLSLKK